MRQKKQHAFIFRTCVCFFGYEIWKQKQQVYWYLEAWKKINREIGTEDTDFRTTYLQVVIETISRNTHKEECGRQNSKHKNNLQESYQKPVFMVSTMDETTS